MNDLQRQIFEQIRTGNHWAPDICEALKQPHEIIWPEIRALIKAKEIFNLQDGSLHVPVYGVHYGGYSE